MDILLVQPPIRDFYLTAKRTIPYGLACISAALKKEGFSVDILDAMAVNKSRALPVPPEMEYLNHFYGRADISPFCLFHGYRHFGYSYQHLQKRILESRAFIVGISSLFTPYAEAAGHTADIVRRTLPECTIVLGGHHPTALPEQAMANRSVDFVIRGEGETAMPLLAKALKNNRDVSGIPGIVFRKPNGVLHVSAPAVMPELDNQPLPDRTAVKNLYYRRGRCLSTVVVTSRGCPMKCSYCALANDNLYPYRQRSVTSVLDEIAEAVEDFGTTFIDFEDENLSFSKPWFMALLSEISRRFGGRLELRAMNGLFPPTIDETMVKGMKQAGFKTLNLSLGSACLDQLKRFRRPDVRRAFDGALDLAKKYSLDAVGYVIGGAPGQTAEQSLEDLLYLSRRRVLAGLSVFYPAPGSEDFEMSKRLNLLPRHLSLFRSSALPISHSTSRLESVTLMRISRIINFMKFLTDQGRPLPAPSQINTESLTPPFNRIDVGELLLKGFLYDGMIPGITPGGEIFRHRIDEYLAQRFLSRLKGMSICGTRS